MIIIIKHNLKITKYVLGIEWIGTNEQKQCFLYLYTKNCLVIVSANLKWKIESMPGLHIITLLFWNSILLWSTQILENDNRS